MLATAVASLPTGAGWAFEFKWDGVRALLDIADRGVRLASRAGNDITPAYPELVALANAVAGAGDALLDGEIVAFADGRPSFELLQSRMHVRSAADAARLSRIAPVTFMAFDLLRRYGVDLTGRAYVERRATLDRWLGEQPGWTVSPFFDDGPATLTAAREHGLEGVVAKRLAAPYRPGVRSPDWVKLRFTSSGEFVVIGWEAAADSPATLSSLVLGYYADGALAFAGKVGSGLDGRTSTALHAQLVQSATCPLPAVPAVQGGWGTPGRIVRWTEPTVVVEVEYSGWTAEGRLRQPVLRRVRTDKAVEEATGDG